MGEGWRKHGMMRHGGMMGPLAMRIIFALMDRDGDGTISLEEFQAAHERIFKAMDADKDGTVSQEEMLDFVRGPVKSAPQHWAVRDSTNSRGRLKECGGFVVLPLRASAGHFILSDNVESVD